MMMGGTGLLFSAGGGSWPETVLLLIFISGGGPKQSDERSREAVHVAHNCKSQTHV